MESVAMTTILKLKKIKNMHFFFCLYIPFKTNGSANSGHTISMNKTGTNSKWNPLKKFLLIEYKTIYSNIFLPNLV